MSRNSQPDHSTSTSSLQGPCTVSCFRCCHLPRHAGKAEAHRVQTSLCRATVKFSKHPTDFPCLHKRAVRTSSQGEPSALQPTRDLPHKAHSWCRHSILSKPWTTEQRPAAYSSTPSCPTLQHPLSRARGENLTRLSHSRCLLGPSCTWGCWALTSWLPRSHSTSCWLHFF